MRPLLIPSSTIRTTVRTIHDGQARQRTSITLLLRMCVILPARALKNLSQWLTPPANTSAKLSSWSIFILEE